MSPVWGLSDEPTILSHDSTKDYELEILTDPKVNCKIDNYVAPDMLKTILCSSIASTWKAHVAIILAFGRNRHASVEPLAGKLLAVS
ncbi:hypothetical protein RRG08_017438 [Elysia crispata]|uniref:Uncharacterized protein n=1 Tax=Elysia crispata TaxID=231223 RepID=A0AAE1DPB6_9GAST|nr:hypothetical protein RRG08_017438 [Elysia crispata]